MNILQQVLAAASAPVLGVLLAVQAYFFPAPVVQAPVDEARSGMTIATPIANFQTQLAASIGISDTSMTLVSTSTKDGDSLTIGTTYAFTIDEGTATEEHVIGIASSSRSIVSLTRGVSVIDGKTSVTANKKRHGRGASVKITTAPIVLQLARITNGNETFPNVLQYATSVTNALIGANAQNIANVAYVASTSYSGTVDATDAIKGIVEEATKAEVSAGTATGGTGALLFIPARVANSTSTATTTVPVTKTNGKLSQGFLDLTEAWTLSGTSTLSNAAAITVTTATSTATSTDPFNLLPAGVIQIYASSSAPAGWLLANGTQYATSSYPRLFAVVGYLYGGSTSTFAVPDIRGRFVTGPSSTLSTTIGATGGSATSTVIGSITTSNVGATGGPLGFAANGTYSLDNGQTTSPAPYIILNYIIKY